MNFLPGQKKGEEKKKSRFSTRFFLTLMIKKSDVNQGDLFLPKFLVFLLSLKGKVPKLRGGMVDAKYVVF